MEAKVESTEDKIISATIKLLDKNGLTGTTTQQIASESGFSEVTVYRKFKTKENLFNIAKRTYYDTFFKQLDEILDYNLDADIREYLLYIWKEIIILSDNETNMIKIAIDEFRDSDSKNKGLPKFANIVIDKLSKFFQYQIDTGKIRKINSKLAAYNIFCLIFESIVFWKVYDSNLSNIDVDSYLNDFLDMFMNGISINS